MRRPVIMRQLESLQEKGWLENAAPLFAIAEKTMASEHTVAGLVHGDLYFRNLLVNHEGELSGVIDWGDCHIGSPAVDLSVAFTLLPAKGREVFFSIYGLVDKETYEHARFRALNTVCNLMHYGLDEKNQAIIKETQIAFANILDV